MVPHSQGYRNTFGVSREMGLLTGSVFIADVVPPPLSYLDNKFGIRSYVLSFSCLLPHEP